MANCSLSWNTFNGDIPDSLLHFFVFYCCAICVVGITANGIALWCVVTCSRTSTSSKILLCALFSTTLLMCVVVMPFMVHLSLAKLWCDRGVPRPLLHVVILNYIVLTMMELFYIFVMALLRTLAVWSPMRRQIQVRAAIAVTVGIALYNTSMTILVAAQFWKTLMPRHTRYIILKVYNAFHFVLPVLLTLVCYLSTIAVVRRNTRRLVANTAQSTVASGKVMDQATRAMLAVFISNLLLGLPHSIYHIVPYDHRVFSYVIMHSIFFTHLFVDPLAFLCSNLHHRRRVLQALRSLFCLATHTVVESPPTSLTTQTTSIQKDVEEGQRNTSSGEKSKQEPPNLQLDNIPKAVAVWYPQGHQLKLRTSVALVMGVVVFATATTVDCIAESPYMHTTPSRLVTVLHYVLPMVLTLACYSSMIFAVRRNKHRLAATPDTAGTGQVMDQATRAMLAVFISNLLLSLPHSINHILPHAVHVIPHSGPARSELLAGHSLHCRAPPPLTSSSASSKMSQKNHS
ncbi:hypothetical protein O3P69_000031 [Scylla paramamosain]|uniref:G-protein coupled receptors family 1 profile domain-containing protein n=1 Tax=Scylla paramamosain TaxID=85552 RepID=A0AAW0UU47_SCYPA